MEPTKSSDRQASSEVERLLEADARRPRSTLPPDLMASLFEDVQKQTHASPSSIRSKLRELPTPTRTLLALGSSMVYVALHIFAQGLRSDLSGRNLAIFTTLFLGLVVLLLLSIRVAHRAIHRPPPGLGTRIFGGLMAGLPLILAANASFMTGGSAADLGNRAWKVHIFCLSATGLAALLVTGLVLLFERNEPPSPWRLIAAAGGAGAIGFIAQTAHCPYVDPSHLLISHAPPGILLGCALLLHRLLRQRRVLPSSP